MCTDPAAYLLTWHTFGRKLPHHERSLTARSPIQTDRPLLAAEPVLHRNPRVQAKRPRIHLNSQARSGVRQAIRAVVAHRKWQLYAMHVRTNHVHVVVAGNAEPERMLHDFKTWSTQRITDAGYWPRGEKTWSRHGNTRLLWDEEEVTSAVDYVLNGQGVLLR